MKHFSFTIIAIALLLAPCARLQAQYPGIEEDIAKNRKGQIILRGKPGEAVKVEQLSHDFWFGCAISNGMVEGNWSEDDVRRYKENFLKNFNSAVTENAVKWLSMEREKGNVNYKTVDEILRWTEANKIPLRAHNLFWGIPKFVQKWVQELNDEELAATLQNRARTITSRYRGRFAEYDLNNEMIHGNYYEERLGPGITKKMAQWALDGDPSAKLYLNDYDILTGNRLDDFLSHIRELLAQQVPIAGIGVQGHLHSDTFDRRELRRSLDSLALFGLPIKITEFNMPGQRSDYYREKITTMSQEQENQKAKELADYYRICFAHNAVDGILMWGFWAKANWIPASSLYREDWSPTPAADAYRNLIFKEWWTNYAGKLNDQGELTIPAFFGHHKVTVGNKSKNVHLPKQAGNVKVNF